MLEKGVIDEQVFDTIHAALPEESPLSGPLRTAGNQTVAPARSSANPTPAQSTGRSSPPREEVLFDSSRNEKNPYHNPQPSHSPAPPSYDATPPPAMPPRSAKPVIAHARALYAYNASDGRDCSFVKDDKIAVHEYMNQDWWMGQNLRTGQEGIFPRNYVFVEQQEKAPVPQYGYPAQQQYANGPPQQQNPYNSNVPPMAVAEGSNGQQEHQGSGKAGEYGKKFGKKLGNAAIFGAGATIGGNIVNSIF